MHTIATPTGDLSIKSIYRTESMTYAMGGSSTSPTGWWPWGIIVVSGLAWTLPAQAQVSVGPISGGTLVEAGTQGQRLESSISGQFSVTVGPSTPNTTIQLLAPVFLSGPNTDPGGTSRTATADVGGTSLTSGGSDTTTLGIGETLVQVDMQVDRPSRYPAGTYQYTVDLIITPN